MARARKELSQAPRGRSSPFVIGEERFLGIIVALVTIRTDLSNDHSRSDALVPYVSIIIMNAV